MSASADLLMARARLGLFERYREARRLSWLQATGTSMRPTLPPGSWMQVQFGALPRHPGEIVLFTRQQAIIAHRVIAIDRDGLVTKGDSSRTFDPPVALTEVLGVVRARRRRRASRPRILGCSGASAYFLSLLSGTEGRLAGRIAADPHTR